MCSYPPGSLGYPTFSPIEPLGPGERCVFPGASCFGVVGVTLTTADQSRDAQFAPKNGQKPQAERVVGAHVCSSQEGAETIPRGGVIFFSRAESCGCPGPTALTVSSSERPQARRWPYLSQERRRPWSGISRNECPTDCSCRM